MLSCIGLIGVCSGLVPVTSADAYMKSNIYFSDRSMVSTTLSTTGSLGQSRKNIYATYGQRQSETVHLCG
jgi:hypothetical protein